ncbi:hypothetical protein D3C85_1177000 [compost metagenome]
MPRLNGHQPAEALAQHKHRPQPQCAADDEQQRPKPAHAFTAKGPEIDAVGIGRQKAAQQPDHPEGRNDPAVGPVFAFPRTQVDLGEQRRDSHDQGGQGNDEQ